MKDSMRKSMAFFAAALCLTLALGAEARPRSTRKATKRLAARQKPPAKTSAPRVEYLTGERTRPLPFSDAVRVGHMLYLSGQIGTDSTFALVPGGIRAE